MPYYLSGDYLNNLEDKGIYPGSKLTLDSFINHPKVPVLPSNGLSLIIAILTNITLFYILKPYVLINVIYMITIPLYPI